MRKIVSIVFLVAGIMFLALGKIFCQKIFHLTSTVNGLIMFWRYSVIKVISIFRTILKL